MQTSLTRKLSFGFAVRQRGPPRRPPRLRVPDGSPPLPSTRHHCKASNEIFIPFIESRFSSGSQGLDLVVNESELFKAEPFTEPPMT
jgi:hypothetical protein